MAGSERLMSSQELTEEGKSCVAMAPAIPLTNFATMAQVAMASVSPTAVVAVMAAHPIPVVMAAHPMPAMMAAYPMPTVMADSLTSVAEMAAHPVMTATEGPLTEEAK
jgi:hypothetical protein